MVPVQPGCWHLVPSATVGRDGGDPLAEAVGAEAAACAGGMPQTSQ
jgi:hypothetical protein